MIKDILLFERHLLAARIFSEKISLESWQKATNAAAADQDGWHDEAFKEASYQVAMRGTELEKLKANFRTANVIEPDQIEPREEADLGAVVTFQEESFPEEVYLLTGMTIEPNSRLITVYSPFGKALRGSKPNVKVKVNLPDGPVNLKIKDVTYDASIVLIDYLREIYEEADKQARELLTPANLKKLFTNMQGSKSDNQRDYLRVLAWITSETAKIEAILYVIQDYNISTPLEKQCTASITEYKRRFEKYEIPYTSLKKDVDLT